VKIAAVALPCLFAGSGHAILLALRWEGGRKSIRLKQLERIVRTVKLSFVQFLGAILASVRSI
jgi:hypothetical protein